MHLTTRTHLQHDTQQIKAVRVIFLQEWFFSVIWMLNVKIHVWVSNTTCSTIVLDVLNILGIRWTVAAKNNGTFVSKLCTNRWDGSVKARLFKISLDCSKSWVCSRKRIKEQPCLCQSQVDFSQECVKTIIGFVSWPTITVACVFINVFVKVFPAAITACVGWPVWSSGFPPACPGTQRC